MATRTVRLDEEAEEIVREVRRETGLSVSGVLKAGIRALRKERSRTSAPLPFDVYRRLELGSGGYSSFPSTAVRKAVRDALRKKHRR